MNELTQFIKASNIVKGFENKFTMSPLIINELLNILLKIYFKVFDESFFWSQ